MLLNSLLCVFKVSVVAIQVGYNCLFQWLFPINFFVFLLPRFAQRIFLCTFCEWLSLAISNCLESNYFGLPTIALVFPLFSCFLLLSK